MESEPVENLPVDDTEAIRGALERARKKGVQLVPHPTKFPSVSETPTLKSSKAKSWTDFVRNARLWTIEDSAGATYQIQRWFSPPGKSHFEPDVKNSLHFDPATPAQVIFDSLIAEAQRAARDIR